MTKWEIGQELIAISDFIGKVEVELRENDKDLLSNQLRIMRMQIGDLFEKNNDHDFGIINSRDLVIKR